MFSEFYDIFWPHLVLLGKNWKEYGEKSWQVQGHKMVVEGEVKKCVCVYNQLLNNPFL